MSTSYLTFTTEINADGITYYVELTGSTCEVWPTTGPIIHSGTIDSLETAHPAILAALLDSGAIKRT